MTAIRNGLFLVLIVFYAVTFKQFGIPQINEWHNQESNRATLYIPVAHTEFEIPRFSYDYVLFALFDAYDGLYEISYKPLTRIKREGPIQFPTYESDNKLGLLVFMQKTMTGEKLPLVVADGYDVTSRLTQSDNFNVSYMRQWTKEEREGVFKYYSTLAGTQRYLFDMAATKQMLQAERTVLVELEDEYYVLLYGINNNTAWVYDPQFRTNNGAVLHFNADGTFVYRNKVRIYSKGVVIEC